MILFIVLSPVGITGSVAIWKVYIKSLRDAIKSQLWPDPVFIGFDAGHQGKFIEMPACRIGQG
jgi:hypothetical protein